MKFAAYSFVFAMMCAPGVAQTPEGETAGAEIERPANLDLWPTIGATIRMSKPSSAEPDMNAAGPAEAATTPAQLRQVLMAPDAYESFVRTGEYPDGAAFAAVIYQLLRDGSFTPEIYGQQPEPALVLEIIDRTHPDGRRFYSFTNGAASAKALPPGNECAVCHKERGAFDGTFSQFYPAISHRS